MGADIPVAVDDPARDDRIIRENFMRELCRRDDEANRNTNPNPGVTPNEFNVREIHEEVLGGFSLDRVVDFLRGFEMINNPFIELVDQERRERVRLTNTGRAHCEELG